MFEDILQKQWSLLSEKNVVVVWACIFGNDVVFFQASESDSDMFTCMSGAAGFIFCLCSVSAFSGRCRIYFLSDRTWKI